MDEKIKILLIEDNPGDARLFRLCLEANERTGYDIISADTLSGAFKLLNKQAIDLVVTDLGLPDSVGMTTFNEIHQKFPGIPIIVLTGQDDEALGLEAVKLGAQDFLTKNHFADQGSALLLTRTISYAIERKKAEEKLQRLNSELEIRVQERTAELRKSEQLYSAIAKNYPNGTINVLDQKMNYVFAEGKELAIRGQMNEQLIGTNFLSKFDTESRHWAELNLNQVFAGKSCSFEITLQNEIYDLNAVPLSGTKDKTEQILVIKTNITKQKLAEEEILNSLKREKELNDMKSRFVAMASHEFRTPLGIILSSANLIERYREEQFEEKRINNTKRIKSAVKNLNGILEEFLSVEIINSGMVEMNKEKFDVVDLCEEITEEMRSTINPATELRFNFIGNRKEVELDKSKLRNIVINFLSNAIKYSPGSGLIEFNVELINGHLSISVKDGGIGIPIEEQKHIFQNFFRAKNALGFQGTGLGLNIVKKYVELMNGSINFTSVPEKGSVFTASFPQ